MYGDVLIWINSNRLKFNTDKTEVMPIGSTSRIALVEIECSNIGGSSVPFKTSVKYLGVHLDRTLSVRNHIGSDTSRINQTVSLSKCHCRTCRGNNHFSSWLLQLSLRSCTSRPDRLFTANQNNAARLVAKKNHKTKQTKKNNKKTKTKKKENEITLHLSSKNFTSYLWNSTASIRSRLWPTAISKALYLHIFLCPSALMNHLVLSNLQKKSY